MIDVVRPSNFAGNMLAGLWRKAFVVAGAPETSEENMKLYSKNIVSGMDTDSGLPYREYYLIASKGYWYMDGITLARWVEDLHTDFIAGLDFVAAGPQVELIELANTLLALQQKRRLLMEASLG